MSWNEVKMALMSKLPQEIQKDPKRLSDSLKGAEECYKLFSYLMQDDLK